MVLPKTKLYECPMMDANKIKYNVKAQSVFESTVTLKYDSFIKL